MDTETEQRKERTELQIAAFLAREML